MGIRYTPKTNVSHLCVYVKKKIQLIRSKINMIKKKIICKKKKKIVLERRIGQKNVYILNYPF